MSVPPAAVKPPPGRGWYVLAGVLTVATIAATSLFIVYRINGLGSQLIQVVVPGEAKLTLSEPGSYTVFHEYNSVVDGEVYHANSVSGLSVTVLSPEGRAITLTTPAASSRYRFSNRTGVSIFTFDVTKPGVYLLAAAYKNSHSEPKTVLTVGTGFIGGIFVTVLISLLIMFAGFGAAVAIGVSTYLARRRARLAGALAS
ncbi:MAG TPA: hypothetical protein VMG39_14990 [Pseudolabrys sp.]|nr:hypothetical protein [Pseudolabrys sp.]